MYLITRLDVNYQIVARPTGTTTDPVTRQVIAITWPTVVTCNPAIVNPNNDIGRMPPQYTFVRITAHNPSTGNPCRESKEGNTSSQKRLL